MPDFKPVKVFLVCIKCGGRYDPQHPDDQAVFWNGSAWCPTCYRAEIVRQQREGGS